MYWIAVAAPWFPIALAGLLMLMAQLDRDNDGIACEPWFRFGFW